MDMSKAREIIVSHGVVGVCYENREVWIEELFEDSESARVKVLETDQEYLVPVDKLDFDENEK